MLHLSVMSNSATLWTVAHQAPLSMGFSRQEYWGGLPCPPPGDLPNPGIKPRSLALQAYSLPSGHHIPKIPKTYPYTNYLFKSSPQSFGLYFCPISGKNKNSCFLKDSDV